MDAFVECGVFMQIAGVEDDPAPAPAPKKATSSISGNQWAQQLEKSYGAVSTGGGGDRRPTEPRSERNTMVNIVGYNQDAPARAPAAQPSHHGDYGNRGSSFGYDNIAGAQPVPWNLVVLILLTGRITLLEVQ